LCQMKSWFERPKKSFIFSNHWRINWIIFHCTCVNTECCLPWPVLCRWVQRLAKRAWGWPDQLYWYRC
jgi:hypothetical protein